MRTKMEIKQYEEIRDNVIQELSLKYKLSTMMKFTENVIDATIKQMEKE